MPSCCAGAPSQFSSPGELKMCPCRWPCLPFTPSATPPRVFVSTFLISLAAARIASFGAALHQRSEYGAARWTRIYVGWPTPFRVCRGHLRLPGRPSPGRDDPCGSGRSPVAASTLAVLNRYEKQPITPSTERGCGQSWSYSRVWIELFRGTLIRTIPRRRGIVRPGLLAKSWHKCGLRYGCSEGTRFVANRIPSPRCVYARRSGVGVEPRGIEPLTSALPARRSPS